MVTIRAATFLIGLSLLEILPVVLAHGHEEHASKETSTAMAAGAAPSPSAAVAGPESYFARKEMSSWMLGHIALMVVAWFFMLPVGVVLSIAGSRLAVIVQLAFLSVHGAGILLSAVYTGRVPDLYPNNAHHRLGWIVTWVMVAHFVMLLVKLAINLAKSPNHGSFEEQTFLFPATVNDVEQDHHYQRAESPDPYRFSGDSGHYTASEGSRSHSVSSVVGHTADEEEKIREYEAAHASLQTAFAEKPGVLRHPKVQRFATRLTAIVSTKTLRILEMALNLINRTILLLAFVTIISGMVVYGGVFRGSRIFSGLAHTIKGGIFFWYGLLTLGRWMGCFAESGWAWNVRPPVGMVSSRKAAFPSAEWTESFVMFFYGFTNVFLEHLAAWGGAWSPMDLEHVSISIMFFGGGLCGMLIESRRIRDLLNTTILSSPTAHFQKEIQAGLTPPSTYSTSLNPIPALVVLLLGIMMSSHHQHTMVSTMVHKQWGTLLVGSALARAVTYLLTYLSPPTSFLPSRPPSELVSSFCLISGGIIFMASNSDTMDAMDKAGIHAMFPFTVTMGFTAFLMAWSILVLAIKGWATRRQA